MSRIVNLLLRRIVENNFAKTVKTFIPNLWSLEVDIHISVAELVIDLYCGISDFILTILLKC